MNHPLEAVLVGFQVLGPCVPGHQEGILCCTLTLDQSLCPFPVNILALVILLLEYEKSSVISGYAFFFISNNYRKH